MDMAGPFGQLIESKAQASLKNWKMWVISMACH
jgi:hypothetical protein